MAIERPAGLSLTRLSPGEATEAAHDLALQRGGQPIPGDPLDG